MRSMDWVKEPAIPLEEIAMILDTHRRTLQNYRCYGRNGKTSRLVSSLTVILFNLINQSLARMLLPIFGDSSRRVLKGRTTFDIDLKNRSNGEQTYFGKTSGRHAFKTHIESIGYSLRRI